MSVSFVAVTVLVDSYFWQRWLWPEGEVFYFNAVENKSHLWGFNRDEQVLLGLELVALTFITIYSFLPHKELRFIIYVIPIFNLVAAYFWDYVEIRLRVCRSIKATGQAGSWNMKGHKKPTSPIMHRIYWVAVVLCYASIFVNLCASFGLLYCSSYNYPGGEAISKLNTWPGLAERRDVHVFVSNLAAQTGVNRFQQVHAHWTYNKTEHVDDDTDALVKGPFTHFIVEASKDTLAARTDAFRRLFTVISFSGIKYIPENTFWSKFKVSLVPALVVYERINQI
ncbi:unnamed protein product [Mesocestoides corti]|uniref:Mannosyltransferase n=1 Tax=Mesocestoides corti TaxID=53468 RepID=A0A3P6I4D4_MESCO|nr:unnamed protein product [Mesocestoides corti]